MEINIPLEIKAIRATLGISQQELAELTGHTRCTIADVETNRTRCTAKLWLKVQALSRKRKRAA
jgi:DNA-binding XRE family transcriptional regulator